MKHRKLVLLCLFVPHLANFSFGNSLPCLTTPAPDESCLQIHNWSDFETAIKYHPSNINTTTPLIFCPFFIQKSTTSALRIKKRIQIICLKPGQCSIDTSASGGVSILKLDIFRKNGSILIQGIKFLNSASAIHVLSKVSSEAVFCDCEFHR